MMLQVPNTPPPQEIALVKGLPGCDWLITRNPWFFDLGDPELKPRQIQTHDLSCSFTSQGRDISIQKSPSQGRNPWSNMILHQPVWWWDVVIAIVHPPFAKKRRFSKVELEWSCFFSKEVGSLQIDRYVFYREMFVLLPFQIGRFSSSWTDAFQDLTPLVSRSGFLNVLSPPPSERVISWCLFREVRELELPFSRKFDHLVIYPFTDPLFLRGHWLDHQDMFSLDFYVLETIICLKSWLI